MADDRLEATLQISVLAALCLDPGHGAAVAGMVRPEHFDTPYRDFVTRVLGYRARYRKPPGKSHVRDLALQSSSGRDGDTLVDRLVPKILALTDANFGYVATRAEGFIRSQVLKSALIEAGDRYQQPDEGVVPDVERILSKALRFRQQTLDTGIFLDDPRGLDFLEKGGEIISLGIPELDALGIGLTRKELLLFIAPKGSGKSWACVHAGKQALIQRQRVLHVTLEMDEFKVLRRYYQSVFSVGRNADRVPRVVLEFDELDRMIGFRQKSFKPDLYLTNPKIRKLLKAKMARFGMRFGGLVIKEFPTSSLTIDKLLTYLDYLESVEGFVPDVLIVDYPKLGSYDRRDIRVGLGHYVEQLRGVGVARNMAVFAPHQGNRSTIGAKRTRSRDAGEDISVVQTADTVLALSRTDFEKQLGLGRLSIEHARDSGDGQLILLVQSYPTGQFVLDSARMNQSYWDQMKELSGQDDSADGD